MKRFPRFLRLTLLLPLCCLPALAQDSPPSPVKHGTGAPSSCPVGKVYVDDSNGHVWVNKTGVGCFDSTAAASATPGGTSGQIQYNNAATTFYVKESGAGNTGWVAK